MWSDKEPYVAACSIYQRVKDHTTAKPRMLQPLPPPVELFKCYTIYFIFRLPLCKEANKIMTLVDRATKQVNLIPVHESVTTVGLQWVV